MTHYKDYCYEQDKMIPKENPSIQRGMRIAGWKEPSILAEYRNNESSTGNPMNGSRQKITHLPEFAGRLFLQAR